jgi:hypothetical protein
VKKVSVSFRSHPSEEVWELYSLNRLPDDQVTRLEEHLFVCHQCQDLLDEFDRYAPAVKAGIRELRRAPKESTLRRLRRVLWPQAALPRFAWATVAAGLILAAYISFHTQTPPAVAITLVSLRGGTDGNASVPAGTRLELGLVAPEVKQSSALRIEIVDVSGKQVWTGQPKSVDGKLDAVVAQGLSSGLYWVRLYNASELIQEYGLRAK